MPRSMEDQLRRAIRDSGMSQVQVARKARMDMGTLSEFMLGKQESLRLKTAQRLVKVLGMRLALEPAARSVKRGKAPARSPKTKKKTRRRSR